MKKIIKDLNENIITEMPIGSIEIIRPPFKCLITRKGQEDPEIGNRVIVTCIVTLFSESKIVPFNESIFGKYCRYWNDEYQKTEDFIDTTWAKAFEQAEIYFKEECSRYERLVSERELFLKNAE